MIRATKNLMHTAGLCLDLSWRLFKHTIGAKYRKSFLGYFWMVAPALLITAAVTLANRAGVLSVGRTELPYPLFVLIGTLLWQVFADCVDVARRAFDGARSFITRVHFSRTAIILAQFYECLITTAVRTAVVVLGAAIFGNLTPAGAGLMLVGFLGCALLGLGMGLLLMPCLLLFEDLQNTLKLVLTYGLFLTPALYMPAAGSVFGTVVAANPLTPIMTAAREGAAGLSASEPFVFFSVLAVAGLLTLAGFLLARIAAPIVIERMLLGGR